MERSLDGKRLARALASGLSENQNGLQTCLYSQYRAPALLLLLDDLLLWRGLLWLLDDLLWLLRDLLLGDGLLLGRGLLLDDGLLLHDLLLWRGLQASELVGRLDLDELSALDEPLEGLGEGGAEGLGQLVVGLHVLLDRNGGRARAVLQRHDGFFNHDLVGWVGRRGGLLRLLRGCSWHLSRKGGAVVVNWLGSFLGFRFVGRRVAVRSWSTACSFKVPM